jgi:hypothetical protein
VSDGFGNLKTAAKPITEVEERTLLSLLIEELNNLFPLKLAEDFMSDRVIDDDNSGKPRTAWHWFSLVAASCCG